MTETTSGSSLDVRGLILVPAVITLAITLLRLAGELGHRSHILFNTAAGGGMAIIGISWLPFIFGPYFAVKLVRAGHGPSGAWKTFGLTVLGIVILMVGGVIGFGPQIKFPGREILGILLMVLGPALVIFGWPALFKVLVAYGYAARIPVVILMFFALRGQWGTHYDALPAGYSGTSFLREYMMLAVLPQMVIWIAFTVLVGALVGSLVCALAFRGKTTSVAA
ncbi:MAG: hypothetical protein ABSF71_15500 [Terriglobia bacterium]|jgi:hypothetical protein